MKGAFLVPTASRATRFVVLVLMLVLVLGSGLYFIGEKFRAAHAFAGRNLATPATGSRSLPSVCNRELAQGHTVFVDFTAAWCITCKFNEATVLESAAVREAFQRHGIVKIQSRLDQRRSRDHENFETIWPAGCPIVRALPGGQIEPIVVSGIAHAKALFWINSKPSRRTLPLQ